MTILHIKMYINRMSKMLSVKQNIPYVPSLNNAQGLHYLSHIQKDCNILEPSMKLIENFESCIEGFSLTNNVEKEYISSLSNIEKQEAEFQQKYDAYVKLLDEYNKMNLANINQRNAFITNCPSGYSLQSDGLTCVNESNDASCTLDERETGQLRCKFVGYCPTGYSNYGDGTACRDNENPNNKCSLEGNYDLARCNDSDRVYTNCPSGYNLTEDGIICKTSSGNECSLNERGDGMKCKYVGKCPSGYQNQGDGSACSNGKERCTLYGNPKIKVKCGDLSIISIKEQLDNANEELMNIASEIYSNTLRLKEETDGVDIKIESTNETLHDKVNKYKNILDNFNKADNKTVTLNAMLQDSVIRNKSNNLKYLAWTMLAGVALFATYKVYKS